MSIIDLKPDFHVLDPDKMSGPRTVILIWLTAVFSLNFLDRQVLSLFAQPIKTEFLLSDTQIGLLYGFGFAVIYGTAGFPLARIADRGNRSKMVNVALLIFSLMTAVCAFATGYWQLIAARVGVALGESGTNPPSHSIISDLYDRGERTVAMSVFSLGPHIGLLFGFAGLGWIGSHWGWRAAFVVVGVMGVIVFLLGLIGIREPVRTHGTGSRTAISTSNALRLAFRTRSSRHVFVGSTIFSLTCYAILSFLPSMLVRDGLSVSQTGLTFSLIFGLAGACGTLMGGLVSERISKGNPATRLKVLSVVLLLSAPAWMAVFISRDISLTVGLLVLPAAFQGFYLGPTFSTIQALVHPSVRATAAAALVFSGNVIGLSLGPLLIGLVSDALSGVTGSASLHYALLLAGPLCVWSAYHYWTAAKYVVSDLETGVSL